MQKFYKILLLTTTWVLCGIQLVFCTEIEDLNFEDRHSQFYHDTPSGIRYYHLLSPCGDYTKLKLIIRSDKKDYNSGDPVNISFFVRNDSNSKVHIYASYRVSHFTHLWKLFHSNYGEVAKTPKWETEFQEEIIRKRIGTYYEDLWGTISGFNYIKLQPGQEFGLRSSIQLNDYFDLKKPDTYELTCFVPTFIIGQCYEPPLQSNTLTFRVLEEGEKARDIETGINPPKGEEVFKQPKPPKNVFYLWGLPGMPIDVSPAEYYRLPAEEREAHIIKPPEQP